LLKPDSVLWCRYARVISNVTYSLVEPSCRTRTNLCVLQLQTLQSNLHYLLGRL